MANIFISERYESYNSMCELKEMLKQLDSLELWIKDNYGHTDWSKVVRERNALSCKIASRERRDEMIRFPQKVKPSAEYSLSKNIHFQTN